ncbi:hypothetical protein GOP47_0003282 [Adiantum capillus-veneris]|nr:hypothetical protein GOP47_0003282 [Adiantum capillus-veneris]
MPAERSGMRRCNRFGCEESDRDGATCAAAMDTFDKSEHKPTQQAATKSEEVVLEPSLGMEQQQ